MHVHVLYMYMYSCSKVAWSTVSYLYQLSNPSLKNYPMYINIIVVLGAKLGSIHVHCMYTGRQVFLSHDIL